MSGWLAIMNAAPADIKKLTTAVQDSDGAAAKMAETMQDNLGGDMTRLSSQFEGLQIMIYEKFEPALRSGVELLSKFGNAIAWLVDHSSQISAFFKVLIAGVASYVAYTTAIKVMTFGWKSLVIVQKAVAAAQWLMNAAMAANPIGLIVAAIAALITAFVLLWKNSEGFREFWINLWEGIKNIASIVWEAISGFFSSAWDKIKEIWGGLTDFFKGIWDGVKEIFSSIKDWVDVNIVQPLIERFQPLITFFKEAWAIIRELAEGCWIAIKAIWGVVSAWFNQHIIEPVRNFFSKLWSGISSAAGTAWNAIKNVWNTVSSWFNTTIIQPVTDFFSKMWEKLRTGASQAWEAIKNVFSPVVEWFRGKFTEAWTKVKNVFSAGGRIFAGIKDGITSAFKNIVNAIIRGINKVIAVPFNAINKILDKIRNVTIVGIRPFENLISRFTVPQIPLLEKGGVIRKPTTVLAGENGPEAIIPLKNNREWIRSVAAELSNILGFSSGGIVKNSVSNTATTNFTQNIYAPQAPSRLELYRQTKNLLSLAESVKGA